MRKIFMISEEKLKRKVGALGRLLRTIEKS